MIGTKLSQGLVHQVSADLAKELETSTKLTRLWEELTPIGRNEFLCWIENAKQDTTRQRRIERTKEELQEGAKRPCCWVGCIHRTDKKPSQWQQKVLIEQAGKHSQR